MNESNLIPNSERTPQQLKEQTRRGGIASGKSRRAKKTLSDRIKLALTISTNENLKALKRQIREVLPNRHIIANRELIKTYLAQARTIRDCGVDVYNLLRIAQAPESQEIALKATNALWDREVGKPMQEIQSSNTQEIKNTTIVTKEELEDKRKRMKEELLN